MSSMKRNDNLADDAVKEIVVDLMEVGINVLSVNNLYKTQNEITLQKIASDVDTPPKLLTAFTEYTTHPGIPMNFLSYVARNPSTPANTLIKLSKMTRESVLDSLATNPNAPTDALDRIFEYFIKPFSEPERSQGYGRGYTLSSYFRTLKRIFDHPSTSPESFQKAYDTQDRDLYVMLASSKVTPGDILLRLSNTHDILTLKALVTNPNAPYELVVELAGSKRLRGEVARRKDVATYVEHIDFASFDAMNAKILAESPYATTELIDMLALTHGQKSPMVNMAACSSPLCSVSNVLDVMSSYPQAAIHVAHYLFERESGRYEQFAAYMLTKHEVDITSIPDNMVYEIMGWTSD
jgi:hypothetical protein